MNKILIRQWENGNFPFNQNILHFSEPIPFKALQSVLGITFDLLYSMYGNKKLLYLEDWHNEDGLETQHSSAEWEKLQEIISSDRALCELRGKEFEVYLAYFPESFDFILRFRISDIFDEPGYSGLSGLLDVTASDEMLEVIEEHFPEELKEMQAGIKQSLFR